MVGFFYSIMICDALRKGRFADCRWQWFFNRRVREGRRRGRKVA